MTPQDITRARNLITIRDGTTVLTFNSALIGRVEMDRQPLTGPDYVWSVELVTAGGHHYLLGNFDETQAQRIRQKLVDTWRDALTSKHTR